VAIVNGYATLNELKARMGVPVSDTADDSIMEAVIEAASRMIDKFCNRFFYQTSAGQVRYFTPASEVLTFVDDVVTVTAIATDRNLDRTWSNVIPAADYELGPLNNAVSSWPYTEIRMKPLAASPSTSGSRWSRSRGHGDGRRYPMPSTRLALSRRPDTSRERTPRLALPVAARWVSRLR